MKKLTTKQFIEKAMKKHGDKYDYSLSVYNGGKSKIKIICPIHGLFTQEVRVHINNGSGCPKCANTIIAKKISMDKKHFLNKSKKIHNNKYDYSLVEYKNAKQNIKIICKIHGIFEQTPSNHYKGLGCPKCGNISKSNKLVKSTENFLIDAKKIHKNLYDYSLVEYKNAKQNIKIICKIHGIFEQTPNKHLQGQGCPICKVSRGEKEIRQILNNNNIKYKRQQVFDDCKNIRKLQFDFYLPEYNTCIEYDGEQHYKSIEYFGGVKSFKLRQKRDMIKNDYCKNNNIKLLRIKYDENIENKLTEYGFGL
jgi:very-short-patch-repair endonuclease